MTELSAQRTSLLFPEPELDPQSRWKLHSHEVYDLLQRGRKKSCSWIHSTPTTLYIPHQQHWFSHHTQNLTTTISNRDSLSNRCFLSLTHGHCFCVGSEAHEWQKWSRWGIHHKVRRRSCFAEQCGRVLGTRTCGCTWLDYLAPKKTTVTNKRITVYMQQENAWNQSDWNLLVGQAVEGKYTISWICIHGINKRCGTPAVMRKPIKQT